MVLGGVNTAFPAQHRPEDFGQCGDVRNTGKLVVGASAGIDREAKRTTIDVLRVITMGRSTSRRVNTGMDVKSRLRAYEVGMPARRILTSSALRRT